MEFDVKKHFPRKKGFGETALSIPDMQAEIARLQAEVEKWKEFSFDRDIKLIFEQERANTARNDALEEAEREFLYDCSGLHPSDRKAVRRIIRALKTGDK